MIVLKAAQANLLEALQSVAGIVERRHTLPILANVLMRKTGESIEFTTSDLEIQVRTSATLGGDAGTLSTTVGARKLIDMVKARRVYARWAARLSAARSRWRPGWPACRSRGTPPRPCSGTGPGRAPS